MNWPVMRPALLSVVQAATGIKSVVWKGSKEEAGWSSTGIVAKCSCSSPRVIGCDTERRAKYANGVRTKTLCGPRQFTFTVRIETQDQTDAGIALNLADRLLVRVWREANATVLRTAQMSIANIKITQAIDGIVLQGRTVSIAVVEMIMNGVENDVDDTAGAADWIAQVSATGSLTREDGTVESVPELTKRVQ